MKEELSPLIKPYLVRNQNNTQKIVPTTSHMVMLLGLGGGSQWDSGSLGKAGQDSAGY